MDDIGQQNARAEMRLLMNAIDNEEGERDDRRDAPAGVSSRMRNARMQLRRAAVTRSRLRVSGYITVKAAAQVFGPRAGLPPRSPTLRPRWQKPDAERAAKGRRRQRLARGAPLGHTIGD
ncbi:hypothetical protein MTO96_013320 [Rhipicephalus appendiculatus]